MASEGGSSPRSESIKRKGNAMMDELPSPSPSPPSSPSQPTSPPDYSAPAEKLFLEHFNKVFNRDTAELETVYCNYCGREFKWKSQGYGIFIRHLKYNHPDAMDDTSSQGSAGTDPNVFIYTYSKARTQMAKLVCLMSLRFDIADSDHFEGFVQSLNPAAKRIPREEIIAEIRKLVQESKEALVNDFVDLSSKVSICSNIWTDKWERYDFIEITCHWIDDTWTLQKRLIAFKIFFHERTLAADISRQIFDISQNYGLATKVFAISFDYASAHKASFESLTGACQPSLGAKFFHVRCISHVLTLFVQKGLDKLKDEVEAIRNAALYIFDRTSVTKKWGRFCKKNGLHPRLFLKDMESRWNWTYRLLIETCEYRDALCSFFAEQKFKCDIQISPNQWDAFSNLCQLLKICKEAIEELSGVYYPTSVLVLDNCVKIAILFNSLIGSDDLGGCMAEMMGEWLKYFYDIPNIFLVAKLLDPRVRLDGLEKMLGIYYDALFPVKDDHTPVPSVVVANAKTCLYDLFNEYRTKYSDKLEIIGSSSTSSNDDGSSGDKSLSIRLQNLFDEIKGKRPKRYASNPYEELEAYFTADFEYIDAEFDVLKWWSRRTMSFPIMSLIARDVLAVPASTASVNQTFCLGGYALDERQSTINPQDLEKQILLGDWTRAENRSQENDYDEAEECDTISVGSSDADAVSEDSDNPFD